MDALDAMLTRRSIRKYKDLPVDWDKVGMVLEAGASAPSSGNLQNWKFIVVLDEDRRKEIAQACLEQYWMQNAACHIVIVSEIQKARQFYGTRGERLYAIQNCAAAAENMLIAAHDQGLGSCWVSSFDEEQLRKACGIPDYIRPQAVITLGVPDEIVPAPSRYRLVDVVHIEKWDAHIRDVLWIMKEHAWSVENKLSRQGKKIEKKAKTIKEKFHETTKSILEKIKDQLK